MKTIKISDKTYEKIKDQLKGSEEVKPIENLNDLIGQTYTFWCARYIYHGTVKAVNDTYITLENAGVVYETGELDAKKPSDLQELPHECYVLIQSVEAIIKVRW